MVNVCLDDDAPNRAMYFVESSLGCLGKQLYEMDKEDRDAVLKVAQDVSAELRFLFLEIHMKH